MIQLLRRGGRGAGSTEVTHVEFDVRVAPTRIAAWSSVFPLTRKGRVVFFWSLFGCSAGHYGQGMNPNPSSEH